jgi:hypothetical protein
MFSLLKMRQKMSRFYNILVNGIFLSGITYTEWSPNLSDFLELCTATGVNVQKNTAKLTKNAFKTFGAFNAKHNLSESVPYN